MALQSVTQRSQEQRENFSTQAVGFDHQPNLKEDLFQVRGGLPPSCAITKAACLASSISDLGREAVNNGDGVDVSHAYLMEFAANGIRALLDSVERAVESMEKQA